MSDLLTASAPLWLSNPEQVWQLDSGTIALFAVTIHKGQPIGQRHYLFSLQAGEAMFGVLVSEQFPYGLLAVALEPSHLTVQTVSELSQQNQAFQLVQIWQNHLASVFEATESNFVQLIPEQQPGWQSLPDYLDKLHHHFLFCLNDWLQNRVAVKQAQFQARQQLNRHLTERSLGQLATVMQPACVESVSGNALLVAVGAVGRAMGIQIRPPLRSEDLKRVKEPLESIARASRIRTRRVILSDNWWEADCGPLLAHLEADDRPVALLPVSPNRYELFDPQDQSRIRITATIAQQISPIAYTFYRPLPEAIQTGLALFTFALQGRGRDLQFVLLMGILVSLLGMVAPQATAILIDQAIPDANQALLWQVGGALLAVSFGVALAQLAQGLATLRLQTYAESSSQAALWDRLLKLQVLFFRQYPSGDLLARISAINQIRQRLGGVVLRTLVTSIFSFLILGLLLVYSVGLSLVALVVMLLAVIVTFGTGLLTQRKLRPLQEIEGKLFGLVVQLITGVSKLRVAGAEERAFAYWATRYRQQLQLIQHTQTLEDLNRVFNKLLPLLSSIAVFAVAILLLQDSESGQLSLTTGQFLAFNAAFGILLKGTTDLSQMAIELLEISVLWARIKPILATKPELDEHKADPGRLLGNIKLDHVSFRYRKNGPLNLENVTLEAKAGEFIALVGPSGSGKSTIVRLLLGFEVPENGTLYYDGQDLTGLDIAAVRRQLGVVLQNGRITSASIFDNISGGALISMEEAWEAARMAGFEADIEQMPMGMHTVISEGGTNLSGGQRQRLLIARSLVLKPKILIFDEATSALDNRTQAIVSHSLEQLQVTRIVIAHRLSTIRHADRIYVLATGRLVQQGTFEELVAVPGVFAHLMTRQI